MDAVRLELLAHDEDLCPVNGVAGCWWGAAFGEVTGTHAREHLLDPTGHGLRNDDRARPHQEHLVPVIALAEQHLTTPQRLLAQAASEGGQVAVVDIPEQPHVAEKRDGVGRITHGAARPGPRSPRGG